MGVQEGVIGLKLISVMNAQMFRIPKAPNQICPLMPKRSQWTLLDNLVRFATRSLIAKVFVNHAWRLSGQALAAAVQEGVIGLKLISVMNAQMFPTTLLCEIDVKAIVYSDWE